MDDPAGTAAGIWVVVCACSAWVALYVYAALCLHTIVRKIGAAHTRAAWIPFVNTYLACKLADRPGWCSALLFLPPNYLIYSVLFCWGIADKSYWLWWGGLLLVIPLVVSGLVWIRIAEKRDKPWWVGILMMVPIVNVVVLGYIASDTLQSYVLRETLYVAFLASVALTGIIFIGMAVSLVRLGLSVAQLRSVIPYVITYSLPYALPSSFLVAIVFVFGRLSGKGEVAAMKSSGINLNRVIFPPLLLAVFLAGFTFGLNHFLLPWSCTRVKEMRERLLGEVIKTVGQVEKKYEIGDYLVYVGSVKPKMRGERRRWKNIAVIRFADEFPAETVFAKEGDCFVDESQSVATVRLFNGQVHTSELGKLGKVRNQFTACSYEIDLQTESRIRSGRPKYLSFGNLLRERRKLREESAKVLAHPDVKGRLGHPSTDRERAQKVRDKLYRAYSQVEDKYKGYTHEYAAAQGVLDKIAEQLQEVRSRHLALYQSCQDIAARIGSRQKYRDELARDLKRTRSRRETPKEHIQGLLKEIEEAESEVRKLVQHYQQMQDQDKNVKATLADLEAAMQAEEDKRAQGRASLEKLRPELEAKKKAWEEQHKRVRRFFTLQKMLRAETVFHFRNAGSITIVVFMFIGIPLGILSKRGNVLMALVVSFFAVLVIFYPLTIVGQMASRDGLMTPWFAMWQPNMVVGGIGLILMKWGIRR